MICYGFEKVRTLIAAEPPGFFEKIQVWYNDTKWNLFDSLAISTFLFGKSQLFIYFFCLQFFLFTIFLFTFFQLSDFDVLIRMNLWFPMNIIIVAMEELYMLLSFVTG